MLPGEPGEPYGTVSRTVSPFALDRFEVTVSRFQRFLTAYDTIGWPEPGAGAHPRIPNSGWQAEFNERRVLPTKSQSVRIALQSCGQATDESAAQAHPVGCVSWYLAFAFCIWDGGRLPTEAEWAFAAMGGDQQRAYPWSQSDLDESIDASRAVYNASDSPADGPEDVGSRDGAGPYQHEDLAGNLWEWVADGYSPEHVKGSCHGPYAPAEDATRDCEQLDQTDTRVQKGGSYLNAEFELRNEHRSWAHPDAVDPTFGFRCVHETYQ